MRKINLMTVMLSLMMVSSLFSSIGNNAENFNIVTTNCRMEEISNEISNLEEEFYIKNIPDVFENAFLYHTEDTKEHRMSFYSLMTVESNYFTSYINRNNGNGSVDYGPSQLNSDNIKNELFMEMYKPKSYKYIDTRYTEYMIISYNLYLDLYESYGPEYVFYTYNGGPKAYRYFVNNEYMNSNFIKHVSNYNYNIRNRIIINKQKMNDFIIKSLLTKYILNEDSKYIDIIDLSYYCYMNKIVITDDIVNSFLKKNGLDDNILMKRTRLDNITPIYNIMSDDKRIVNQNIFNSYDMIITHNCTTLWKRDDEEFETVFESNDYDLFGSSLTNLFLFNIKFPI